MQKNKQLLDDFTKFCTEHPELRFWQALRVWTGKDVLIGQDPFYFEGKDK